MVEGSVDAAEISGLSHGSACFDITFQPHLLWLIKCRAA